MSNLANFPSWELKVLCIATQRKQLEEYKKTAVLAYARKPLAVCIQRHASVIMCSHIHPRTPIACNSFIQPAATPRHQSTIQQGSFRSESQCERILAVEQIVPEDLQFRARLAY